MMLITLPGSCASALRLGVDPIWFGILFLICMQSVSAATALLAAHDPGRRRRGAAQGDDGGIFQAVVPYVIMSLLLQPCCCCFRWSPPGCLIGSLDERMKKEITVSAA